MGNSTAVTCFVEIQKLQTHLSLLREEYVKLQRRLVEAEKNYQVAAAGAKDGSDSSGFVARLLKTVSDLYAKELYRYNLTTVNFYIISCSIFVMLKFVILL